MYTHAKTHTIRFDHLPSLILLSLADTLTMTTIIDALAKLRIREAFRDDKSRPRYVSARKIHKSGRKGRISVYRVLDERTDSRGRSIRTYANVEGDNLDEDELGSFVGVREAKHIDTGHIVRQRKDTTPPPLPKIQEPGAPVKNRLIKSIRKPQVCRGRWLQRGNTRQDYAKARALAFAQRNRTQREQDVSLLDHGQQHQHEGSDSGISSNAGITYNRAPKVSTRTSEEFELFCSGALPGPSPGCRGPATTRGNSSRKPQKVIAKHSIIKKMVGPERTPEEHDSSDPSEVLSNSFKQPLLSKQGAARLIFGTGSQEAPRSRRRPDYTDESVGGAERPLSDMRRTGQKHTGEQQEELPSSSQEEEEEAQRHPDKQQPAQPSSSQSSATPDAQHPSSNEDKAADPSTHRMSTPSRPPTSESRRNDAASAVPIRRGLKIRPPTHSLQTGAQDPAAANSLRVFPNTRGGLLERLQGVNAPGTPPYTPDAANAFRKDTVPEAEYEEA
jgi:hypothetical protein